MHDFLTRGCGYAMLKCRTTFPVTALCQLFIMKLVFKASVLLSRLATTQIHIEQDC